jgi:phosphotransferase system enzyme I (PtsI)
MTELSELSLQKHHSAAERLLKGIPASAGIAICSHNVVVIKKLRQSKNIKVSPEKIPSEIEKFTLAIEKSLAELRTVIHDEHETEVQEIMETYSMILQDPTLQQAITKRIYTTRSAVQAIEDEFDAQCSFFQNAKDEAMRERSAELDHVRHRLLVHIGKRKPLNDINSGAIIISHSITPTDLLELHKRGVSAIITEIGGIASHVSILARSLRIPAIIGIPNITKKIPESCTVICDGYSGTVVINPSAHTLLDYEQEQVKEQKKQKALGQIIELPCETTDKHPIKLSANIETLEEVDAAIMSGALGIGLVRTEYLVKSDGSFPSEDEQYQWYKEIAERMYPHTVTIRTFDVGGDKKGGVKREENPALGYRGIRFLLGNKKIFRTQIRAILRASHHKNIKIMLPMISHVKEIKRAKKIIDIVKHQLREAHIPYDTHIPVGIMIETPAACCIAADLGKYSDFFSIGSNDLAQYTLGADRNNGYVADMFNELHPAVLRFMYDAVAGAKANGIPISLCGELAAWNTITSLLIGMGITELSVATPALLLIKSKIRKTHFESAKKTIEKILLSGKIPKEFREKAKKRKIVKK